MDVVRVEKPESNGYQIVRVNCQTHGDGFLGVPPGYIVIWNLEEL